MTTAQSDLSTEQVHTPSQHTYLILDSIFTGFFLELIAVIFAKLSKTYLSFDFTDCSETGVVIGKDSVYNVVVTYPVIIACSVSEIRLMFFCDLKVLRRDIPWETYMSTKLITGTGLQLLRRYDKKPENYKAQLLDDVNYLV